MDRKKQRRAMEVLWGCMAALGLCTAAALAWLLPMPEARGVSISGSRGTFSATVQMPSRLARGERVPVVVLCGGESGELARALAERGMASIALAQPCGGTPDGMAADLNAALAWMRDHGLACGPAALAGHADSGRVVCLYPQLAAREGYLPASALVLWDPDGGKAPEYGTALREAGVPVLLVCSRADQDPGLAKTAAVVAGLPDSAVLAGDGAQPDLCTAAARFLAGVLR